MQVTTEELFARIGRQQIQIEKLEALNAEHCATIAELLSKQQESWQDAQLVERNGSLAEGRRIEN